MSGGSRGVGASSTVKPMPRNSRGRAPHAAAPPTFRGLQDRPTPIAADASRLVERRLEICERTRHSLGGGPDGLAILQRRLQQHRGTGQLLGRSVVKIRCDAAPFVLGRVQERAYEVAPLLGNLDEFTPSEHRSRRAPHGGSAHDPLLSERAIGPVRS